MTHTKTNILQYNEYYPFGLQASTSWTRHDAKNNYLYNDGAELNPTTGWYEMFFRSYDPAIGRMTSADPLAPKYGSLSPYNYAFNKPLLYNDPLGDDSGQNAGRNQYGGDTCPECFNGPTVDEMIEADIAESYERMGLGHIYRDQQYWTRYQTAMRESGPQKRTVINYTLVTAVIDGALISTLTIDVVDEWVESGKTARFFTDPTEAYNYIYSKSFPHGERPREVVAYIVKGGIIVLPTEGYEYNKKVKTELYRKNTPNNGFKFLLPWDVRNQKMFVTFDCMEFEVLASIHTHPNSGNPKFGDMYGKNRSGDWDGLVKGAFSTMYVIGADGIGKGWKDSGVTNYSSSGLHYSYEGSLNELLSGQLTLTP